MEGKYNFMPPNPPRKGGFDYKIMKTSGSFKNGHKGINGFLNKHHTEKTKRKIRESLKIQWKNGIRKPQKGVKHWNWKGGIENYKITKRKYYLDNKEKLLRNCVLWCKNHKEKRKKWNKKWREKNKEKIRFNHRNWLRNKRKNNINFRINGIITTAIWKSLHSKKAGRKWENLVGYTINDLMKHLEEKFDDKMNLENYGSYWQIDHIKPKSLFKYETAEDPEFKKCWALENLQPMEKIANMKKHNYYVLDKVACG